MRLAVVDDDRDVTDSIRPLLRRQGYTVDVYNDPTRAVDEFRPSVYDLILVDISMSGMNGFDGYRELKWKDEEAKIAFMTGFPIRAKEEFERMFPRMDVSFLLGKPFSTSELLRFMERSTGNTKNAYRTLGSRVGAARRQNKPRAIAPRGTAAVNY
jgi:two-component system, OmpR family, response regulator ChvI